MMFLVGRSDRRRSSDERRFALLESLPDALFIVDKSLEIYARQQRRADASAPKCRRSRRAASRSDSGSARIRAAARNDAGARIRRAVRVRPDLRVDRARGRGAFAAVGYRDARSLARRHGTAQRRAAPARGRTAPSPAAAASSGRAVDRRLAHALDVRLRNDAGRLRAARGRRDRQVRRRRLRLSRQSGGAGRGRSNASCGENRCATRPIETGAGFNTKSSRCAGTTERSWARSARRSTSPR